MKKDTLLAHKGRNPGANHGVVNPPVYHASTIVYPTVAAMKAAQANRFGHGQVTYGRHGTPTTFALEDALAALEGGHRAATLPSGLAAICAALLAFVKQGDHVLMVDSVYGPSRNFAMTMLKNFGIETTFYDPMVGAGIAQMIRPNTRVVFTESPGSLTFEVQDVPAIAKAAHAAGAVVLMDNTWAGGYFFRPFEHGVDVSIHAATKYIVGHSDAMLGLVVANEQHFPAVKASVAGLGYCAGPDDVYLALRGLRTMGVRLRQHHETGLSLARWLQARPEVARVLHPALPGSTGHKFWKRDFTGASGLFGCILKPASETAVNAMLDGMKLFAMGYSWGGFESLILHTEPNKLRTAKPLVADGPVLRLHAGLEDPTDLIADLEAGFERLNRAR
ncbi:MAG: cystathionine beta-lyase [Alphaproteobacteria bacterium]|nr:cystathionine beta-lyase [Alphaproteobacteria bacterium]